MSIHIFGMLLTHEGTFSNNRGENEGNTNTLQKVIRVDHRSVKYNDRKFGSWASYLDDDVLGYMHASDETTSRRAPLEVTRAISRTPWTGEVMHNFASPGSNPARDGSDPIPYSVEVHHTRYQFGFALTPESLGRVSNDTECAYDEAERQRPNDRGVSLPSLADSPV